MRFRRVAPYLLGVFLLVLCLLAEASAGTSCTQQETCSSGNTCEGGDCSVMFSRNPATGSVIVQVMIGGIWVTIPNNSYFCVPPGTMVNWTTKSVEFFVRFAPSSSYSSPFTNGQNTVLGTATAGVGLTTVSPDDNDCHSFAVATCDVSPTATGIACGTADPRVVVNGGSGFHKKHAAD